MVLKKDFLRVSVLGLLAAVLTGQSAAAQSGIELNPTVLSEALSEALSFYDRADYETAIYRLTEHGKKYAAESGIAYYFVGESYYNLALAGGIPSQGRISHLEESIRYLNYALENGLTDTYPEKEDITIYKRAWASFRLAELMCDPLKKLQAAYNDFDFIAGGPGDRELTQEGAYMAAEALIRTAILKRIQLYRSINTGEKIALYKEIRQNINMARSHLEDIIKSPMASQYLKACAVFQKQKCILIFARTTVKLKPDVFEAIRDGLTGENARETTIGLVQSLDFQPVTQNLSQAMAIQLHPLIQYEKAYASMFEYLLTGERMFEVNVALDSLPKSLFRSDYLFLQGNRDHKADIEEERFMQLSRNDQSFYYEVSTIYPEALYWLGWVQYIRGSRESEQNFRTFLEKIGSDQCDERINFMKEDAQMRLFYLAFDNNAVTPGLLSVLKQELIQFHPTVPDLQKERNLLLSLVRVGLQEQAGSIFDTVEEVVELIRYMLPKAALVYGKERAQYLRYLDTLLKISQYQKSEQTKFYQGIVTFLRAEIQPDDRDVLNYYRQAADFMKELQKTNSKYVHEARYITARAYFDAAKHESNVGDKEKLYQNAKDIFIQLVREKQSVRSLFYLAEILIHENNHLAAAECYQAVINATCRIDGGEFWCSSARAGLRNSRSRGNLTEIQGLPIDRVLYPENLNQADDEEITLEQFGYQKYVMKNLWVESIDRLTQFGLPPRMLYPAAVRMEDSRFTGRQFESLTAGLKEQIIGLKSGLILNVILPQELTASEQGVTVFYNGKLLTKEQEGYRIESIPLNETAVIEVRNDRCYLYKQIFRFTQPRQMNLYIPLIQKFRFRRINHVPDIGDQLLYLPDRLDKNALFNPCGIFSESSELVQHFDQHLYFRDFACAKDRILAVKDSADQLIQYRLDGSTPDDARDRIFPLDFSRTSFRLMTPEGIAVDSLGNIYVTDVDQNRLFIFDSNGRLRSTIGKHAPIGADSADAVPFVRPKRIALAEDLEGISFEGKKVVRPTLIFVTDRSGIHVMNSRGDMLELIPNTENQSGIYYDLMVTGYGHTSQIFVWNRQKGQVEWFKAEPVMR
ncbi:SBBP repeat-containing protein [bacterium]|nr:SBBP repeat-containing protein [bacterium]